jgi:flagellar biosynthesis protein FlhF
VLQNTMHVKTLTGSSIHAALIEARKLFGDEVVLLESTPPQHNQPARITVVTDQPDPVSAPPRIHPVIEPRLATRPSSAVPQPEPVPVTAGSGFGYPAADRYRHTPVMVAPTMAVPTPATARPAEAPRPGRGSLFPASPPTGVSATPSWKPLEQMLESQMGRLETRLEAIERRLGEAIIGTAHRWTAHPLYAFLLEKGFQPATATRLFDALAEKGHQPEAHTDELRWALAQEMRRLLNIPMPKHAVGTKLFIGPPGAGKTSLILKLLRSEQFFGNRLTTVISILPPNEDHDLPWQSGIELYRRLEVPVQEVATPHAMFQALSRARRFDCILIDTPPLPLQAPAARQTLLHLKQMASAIVPFQVQLVLNANRVLDSFTPAWLEQMHLRPHALTLTHLDETPGLGRLADWLLRMKMPVQFLSNGLCLTDSVQAFTPTWLVEQILEL